LATLNFTPPLLSSLSISLYLNLAVWAVQAGRQAIAIDSYIIDHMGEREKLR